MNEVCVLKYLIGFMFIFTMLNAKVSGDWIGQGEWTYEGQGTHCYMNLSFDQTKDTLTRKNGYFDCIMVGLDVLPATFKIVKNDLINEEGEIVGQIKDNLDELKEVYSDTVTVYSKMLTKDLHMDYEESWMHKNGEEIYHISGRLFTSGN